MKNTHKTVAPAIADNGEDLTILRDVSHAYEILKDLRKRAARHSKKKGRTHQQIGDALGLTRAGATKLVNRDNDEAAAA